MNPMKTSIAIAIAAATLAAMVAPSEALPRIPSSHGVVVQQFGSPTNHGVPAQAGIISSSRVTARFRLPPSCQPRYTPGCYRPKDNDHPSAPKKTGNGVPATGINCTYTTHGLCSPD